MAKFFRAFRRTLAVVLLAIGTSFCIVTITPIVRLMVEATRPDWYSGNGEVLVVLGGSMLVPGTAENATLGQDTYLRCVYASWILHKQSFRYVVVSGDSGIAEKMAKLLICHGVAAGSILIENRATSTYENALYTRRILEQRYGAGAIPEVVVLTSDYHAWRARRVFQRMGFNTQVIPVPDILKRFGFRLERWPAFLLLLNEFSKDAVYAAAGKL